MVGLRSLPSVWRSGMEEKVWVLCMPTRAGVTLPNFPHGRDKDTRERKEKRGLVTSRGKEAPKKRSSTDWSLG